MTLLAAFVALILLHLIEPTLPPSWALVPWLGLVAVRMRRQQEHHVGADIGGAPEVGGSEP